MNAKTLLKYGKTLKQIHDLDRRVRDLREQLPNIGGSSTWHPNGVEVSIGLPDYLAEFPNAKPDLNEYTRDEDSQRRAWMSYPPQFIGWIKPGFALWVTASTPTVDAPPLVTKPMEQAA